MRKFLAIYILILLFAIMLVGGCSHQHLGESKGPVFVLNPEHWTPTPVDLQVAKEHE